MFPRGYCFSMLMTFFLLVLTAMPGSSQELIQKVDDSGCIHWSELVIRCTGVGAPSPEIPEARRSAVVIKSARADALEKLIRTLKGIHITSQTIVAELMSANETLGGRVEKAVEKFNDLGLHYMSDGSVEMEAELFLRGELMDLLLPPTGGGKRITDGLRCPLCGQPWPEEQEVPEDIQLVPIEEEHRGPFSGLIVDGRGLDVSPALAPKVFNEEGKTVYGVEFANRAPSLEAGIVGYEQDFERAQKDKRVGPNPLVVKSLRALGPNKTDLEIDKNDSALLHSMPEHLQFMKECRVIILVD